MIPVMQTRRGGPDVPPEERGDCFDACLASILEVPISETRVPHVDDWWAAAQAAAERHGHRIVYIGGGDPMTADQAGVWLGPIFWIAGVPSLNLGANPDGSPIMHVIVMRGAEVAHDPSLGERWPAGPAPDGFLIHDVMLLVALEPRSSA